ncbi:MAG: M15 family metallopeptidase [Pyrinomonadaceae bacterium]
MTQANSFPPRPPFSYPSGQKVREMFGQFRYELTGNGSIQILDGWANKNIEKVYIPQLAGVEGAPADCRVYFHRRGVRQLKLLFEAWERAGLLHYIKSWGGSFVPRLIRGGRSLSNHAYGSAFDINAAWNGLGREPAKGDREGTVFPLVQIANAHGFYWGGHYNSRLDGMHFELAVLDVFPPVVFPRLVPPAFFHEEEVEHLTDDISANAAPVSVPANNPQPIPPFATEFPQNTAFQAETESQTNSKPNGDGAAMGDAADAAPRFSINYTDYLPLAIVWLKRITKISAIGTFLSGLGITGASAAGLPLSAKIAAAVVIGLIIISVLIVAIAAFIVIGLLFYKLAMKIWEAYQRGNPRLQNIEFCARKPENLKS